MFTRKHLIETSYNIKARHAIQKRYILSLPTVWKSILTKKNERNPIMNQSEKCKLHFVKGNSNSKLLEYKISEIDLFPYQTFRS